HPYRGRAVIGEARALVGVARGGDADHACVGGGIGGSGGAAVSGRRDRDHAALGGEIEGDLELRRGRGAAEAHVHHLCVRQGREVDRPQDVRAAAVTVGRERLEGHDPCGGRGEVHDARDHGAVTVGGVGAVVENGGGSLVHGGGRRGVHPFDTVE